MTTAERDGGVTARASRDRDEMKYGFLFEDVSYQVSF
jgi:hypothetical protein